MFNSVQCETVVFWHLTITMGQTSVERLTQVTYSNGFLSTLIYQMAGSCQNIETIHKALRCSVFFLIHSRLSLGLWQEYHLRNTCIFFSTFALFRFDSMWIFIYVCVCLDASIVYIQYDLAIKKIR